MLAELLVVPAFTPFFAASVAMQTPWLVEALGVGKLAAGMAVACVTAGEYNHEAACGRDALGLPAAWRDGPRPSSCCKELRLEWQVKLCDLEAVFKSGTALDSHTQSFAGLDFWVSIVRSPPHRWQRLEGSSTGGGGRHQQEEGGQTSRNGQGDSSWVLSVHVLARLPDGAQLPSGCRLLMALPTARLMLSQPDGRSLTARLYVCDRDQPPFDAAEGWQCEDCWQTGPRSDWRPDGYADHLRIVLTVPTVL